MNTSSPCTTCPVNSFCDGVGWPDVNYGLCIYSPIDKILLAYPVINPASKYNYFEAVENDIYNFVLANRHAAGIDNCNTEEEIKDRIADYVYDRIWDSNPISGTWNPDRKITSYTNNKSVAAKYVAGNLELLATVLKDDLEFSADIDDVEDILRQPETCDYLIRKYLAYPDKICVKNAARRIYAERMQAKR